MLQSCSLPFLTLLTLSTLQRCVMSIPAHDIVARCNSVVCTMRWRAGVDESCSFVASVVTISKFSLAVGFGRFLGENLGFGLGFSFF